MNPRLRLALALLLPFVAASIQWLLWDDYIKPYVWFLFFPAAFFSAWLAGLKGGLASGIIGALLVWYVFIPPQFSFVLKDAAASASIALFVIMGGLFGWVFERLEQAQRRTAEALDATESANEKITKLYEKTLELDELKSQFFANVSHELRTPLTLIMAPLERQLCPPASADFPEERRKETEMMLRNARLLYRHVSDLLDAAKLEAGGMQADYARVEFAELVRGLAAHFDLTARERNIAWHVATPPAMAIEADGEKLQRILLNLLSNAFKFTPDGGAIEVRLGADGDVALLEVQDNGPGVPETLRAAVFERFRQVEGTANRSHGGTGLGLAIVKEFAELHGGTASVSAAPGGGALFAVRLPLKAPAGTVLHDTAGRLDPVLDRQAVEELAVPAMAEAADTAATHDAPLVLIVEDNADMNAFIAAALRPRYRVASARDGRAGLEQALALAPDLILADVMMPVMSGDAMVLELRRQPEFAGTPIIMLTAKADDMLRVRLLKAGVQDYLNKPFAVNELLARVDGLLIERQRTRTETNRYEQIVATSGDMLAFVDSERRYLVVNPAYAAMFAASPGHLQGRRVEDVVGAAAYAFIAPHLDRAFAGEPHRFFAAPQLPDGRMPVLDAEYRPFREGDRVTGVVVSLRDITELKAAEEALKHRNEELERFDRAAVGREMLMIDLKRQVNALAAELGRPAPHDLSFAEAPAREEKS